MRFFWYTIPLLIAWLGAVVLMTTVTFSVAFYDVPSAAHSRSDVRVTVGFTVAVAGLALLLICLVARMVWSITRGGL